MPAFIESNWLPYYQGSERTDLNPTFTAYRADIDTDGVAQQLRTAFGFLRSHGDRRYSAQSLMKLMDAADRLDTVLAEGQPLNTRDFPSVAVVSTPYEYDEETEVKHGGIVAMAVVLPDNRMMMAVNANTRRQRVGKALYQFVTQFMTHNPIVWIHQANVTGAQFALACQLQPREVNTRGAVAWSQDRIRDEVDDLAVANEDDWAYDDALAMANSRRNSRIRHANAVRRAARRPEYVMPEDDEYYDDEPADVRY